MNNDCKNYMVVVNHNIFDLENEVNKLIRDGFEPVGGIFCQGGYPLIQAMYKPLSKQDGEPK